MDPHQQNDENVLSGLTNGELDRRGFLVAGAGVLTISGLLAACGDDDDSSGTSSDLPESRRRIAFGHPANTAPIYPLMVNGLETIGGERGYEVLTSQANDDLDRQIAEVNTWIAQGVGGIILLPLDPAAVESLTQKAHENDVKFLNYSNKFIESADGSVVFDNPQGARLVGEYAGDWVNETLDGEAKVALLTQNYQDTGRERVFGALEALQEKAPNVEVVAEQEGVFAPETLEVFQSMLQAEPDINVVFCIADDGCIGAEKAFMQTNPSKERQDQMFIAGWDGSIPVLEAILKGGAIRATGVLDLVQIGEDCASATINAIEGEEPTDIVVPYSLADQDHSAEVEELLSRYEAIIG